MKINDKYITRPTNKEGKLDISLVITTDAGEQIPMRVTNLKHLTQILKYRINELNHTCKGMMYIEPQNDD